jgi:hypothetical protein
MKIMFIENRGLTSLWVEISKILIQKGYEIHWIVQNKIYSPKIGTVHYLKMERAYLSKNCINIDKYNFIKQSDRGVHYNKGNIKHYCHHDSCINLILKKVKPNFIFGECTQYHELLTIYNAKNLNIPYLVPFASRYPIDRMFFYLYDTFKAIGGSKELLSDNNIKLMVKGINTNLITPSYMKNKEIPVLLKIKDLLRLLIGWFLGERHITPSPLRRMLNMTSHKVRYIKWEGLSEKEIPERCKGKKIVLYPMQMQPESNIDVYGQPWNNQTEIIRRLAMALKSISAILVVKPNPKSRFELTEDLISVINKNENIVIMSHAVEMKSIINEVDLTLTVTGTVLLEGIFSKRSVACLGSHLMSTFPGVISLERPEDVCNYFPNNYKQYRASNQEINDLLLHLYGQSYPVKIFDPIQNPELMNEKNIERMVDAFEDVMNGYYK